MQRILVSDLLGRSVVCAGHHVGYLDDIRFQLQHNTKDEPGLASVYGFLISPKHRTSYLGFERSNVTRPWVIAKLQRWRHQHTFLVLWDDIASLGPEINLKCGYQAHSPLLDTSASANGTARS